MANCSRQPRWHTRHRLSPKPNPSPPTSSPSPPVPSSMFTPSPACPTSASAHSQSRIRRMPKPPQSRHTAAQGIKFLSDYFAQPFPFPKYEMVLVPGFAYGGMEHAGGTFLREESVLFRTAPTDNNHLAPRRLRPPRAHPSVVRRFRHHALVRRSLAQGRLRAIHGLQDARRAAPQRRHLAALLPIHQARRLWHRRNPRHHSHLPGNS